MMTAEEIMREERERTLAEIDKLPLPEDIRTDVMRLCGALQIALNEVVAALDRPIDQRVGPTAMRLLADEIDRLNKRFVEVGLASRLQ